MASTCIRRQFLSVPADVNDFPPARLPGGELDPRFVIAPATVRLGKLLFFDPIRSDHIRFEFGGMMETTQTGSCGSCHIGEAASKAGQVVSISVGGVGRHEMERDADKTIVRDVMSGAVDILPTGIELLGRGGEVIESGLFDAIDSAGLLAPSAIGFAFNNRLPWGGEAGEPNPEEYPAQEDIVRKASIGHRMANPDSSHIQAVDVYARLVADAFAAEYQACLLSGGPDDYINNDTQFRAIAAFLRTVITRETPRDRFVDGDDAAGLLVEENFHNLGTREHPPQDLARATLGNPDHHDTGRDGVTGDPASPTAAFELNAADLIYSDELKALGAVDGWLRSGLPNGFADDLSRAQLVFIRGNVNGDGRLDIGDPITVINYLFLGHASPDPMVSGDANDDNQIDIADTIYLIRYLFLGGSPPPAPDALSGQDLTL